MSINFFKGYSLCYCNVIYRLVILFVCSMNHIPLYLYRPLLLYAQIVIKSANVVKISR